MKYSGYAPEEITGLAAYLDKRWSQLAIAHDQSVSETSKYIFLVNSGAAVATLTFIGTVERVREQLWSTWMLMMFVLGVVLVGIAHLVRTYELDDLYEGFRKDVTQFYGDHHCFEDVLNADSRRCEGSSYAVMVRNTAFLAFIVGVGIGAVNFNSIAKGEQNVGQKQTTTTQTVPTTPAPSSPTKERRREKDDARRTDIAPVSPTSTASDPKEMMPTKREQP
jgi:hypothetical protein